ncbi:MAG: hypothetical protein MRY72_03975 [Aquisalinus sp.]|nr:hypothetical protein [Aquisalinus sp.]
MRFKLSLVISLLLVGLPGCGQSAQEGAADNLTARAERMAETEETAVITSLAPGDIALTIYTDDLALITERRTVTLPAGRSIIRFEGVSEMMVPQSAILREFTGFTLERNFDFDLISPGALFTGAEGDDVTVTRTNPFTGRVEQKQARVISGGNGVVLEIDGEIETLQCAGLPEKTAFDYVPDSLNPQPTLSIEVNAEEAGEQEIVLSYLATSFGWQADYRLDVHPDGQTGKLVGWLTVYNQTEVSVNEANTAIIAGDLQRLWETRAERGSAKPLVARCWPRGSSKTGTPVEQLSYFGEAPQKAYRRNMPMPAMAEPQMEMMMADSVVVTAARQAELEEFGDYKLYRVPEPTTVSAYQEKQVLFLDKPEIDLEKIHTFDVYSPEGAIGQILPATVEFHLDNSRDGKLGLPLPEGTLRVMTRSGEGRLFYLGEDSVRNLAVDLPAEFAVATAADIQMETRLLNREVTERPGRNAKRAVTVEHSFFNASPEEVTIELKVGEEFYTPITISDENLMRDLDADTPKWRFTLSPESTRLVSYTASWTD